MKNNKKNFFLKIKNKNKFLLIGIPILAVIGSVTGYIVYDNTTKKVIKEVINPEPVTKENEIIFPDINTIDFYDLIEFKDGLPIVGDKMISSIIKSIITRLGTTDGDITFYIREDTTVSKDIFFKWSFGNKEIKKTYNISINIL